MKAISLYSDSAVKELFWCAYLLIRSRQESSDLEPGTGYSPNPYLREVYERPPEGAQLHDWQAARKEYQSELHPKALSLPFPKIPDQLFENAQTPTLTEEDLKFSPRWSDLPIFTKFLASAASALLIFCLGYYALGEAPTPEVSKYQFDGERYVVSTPASLSLDGVRMTDSYIDIREFGYTKGDDRSLSPEDWAGNFDYRSVSFNPDKSIKYLMGHELRIDGKTILKKGDPISLVEQKLGRGRISIKDGDLVYKIQILSSRFKLQGFGIALDRSDYEESELIDVNHT